MKTTLKRLWRRTMHHWPAKLASVAVAGALWVYVLNQQDPITTRQITLSVEPWGVPAGMELLYIEPPKITVQLRGRQSLLDKAAENLRLRADLSKAVVGAQEVEVKIFARPPGVEVVRMSRQKVRAVVDTSVEAKRPVIVETRGLPAEGYRALAPSSEPATVTVRGPASLVERVARVVATIDISGVSATVSQQVKVEPRDEAGLVVSNVHVEPDRVKVVVPLRRVNVKVVPIWPDLTAPAPGLRVTAVTVRPAAVVLSGVPAVLSRIDYISTDTVDIGGLRRGATFSVRLRVPQGVTVVGPASAQVKVTVAPLPELSTPPARPQQSPQPPQGQAETSRPAGGSPPARAAPSIPPAPPESSPQPPASSSGQPSSTPSHG